MLNWVSLLSHACDLVPGSVGRTWVTHTMTMVSVGVCFHDYWPIVQYIVLSIGDSLDSA